MATLPFATATIFNGLGITPTIFLPIIVLVLFVVLVLPAINRSGADPESVTRAAYGYLAQSVGIILMTTGGLPAVYAVIGEQDLTSNMYFGLLLVFVIGGITYLFHDNAVRSIDDTSRAIPAALFFYCWKFIGLLVMLFAGLTFLLNELTTAGNGPPGWWITPLVLFLYGLLLSWFTLQHPHLPVIKTNGAPAIGAKKKVIAVKKTVKGMKNAQTNKR